MKKIVIIILIVGWVANSFAQKESITWDYSVKPGNKEWKKLKTHEKKVEACQIPESILSQMKTKELVRACINYPLLRDIMAFNFLQDGINELRINFTGFNELLSREDASKLLFAEYKRIKPKDFDKSWSLVQKGDYAFKMMAFEIFLSQKEILNMLNNNERKEFVEELLRKLEEKDDREVYGRLSQMTIGLCIIRILEQEGKLSNFSADVSKDEFTLFSEKANLQDIRLLPAIVTMAEDFIN